MLRNYRLPAPRRVIPIAVAVLVAAVAVAAILVVRQSAQSPSPDWTTHVLYGAQGGNEVYHFTSLEEMTRQADLVVTGTITSVSPGAEFGRPGIDRVYFATASLRVTEVASLSSGLSVRTGDTVFVDFFLGGNANVQGFGESVKGLGGLWFLVDQAREAERHGQEPDTAPGEVFRLANSQSLAVAEEGKMTLPLAEPLGDEAALFAAIQGKSLDEVIARVREIPRPE